MTVRVGLIDEAVGDLRRYAKTGRLKDVLSKLVAIEDAGADAGLPLGGGLSGWRKVVVGDRDWRIVFRVDGDVATVLVIGDRSDADCYAAALARLEALDGSEASRTLAGLMLELMREQRQRKRR